MTDKSILLIFDPHFGDRLREVDLSSPIWIVQSNDNDPTIAELWKAKAGDITSFKPQDFGFLMRTVDEHHSGWAELEVIGIIARAAEHTLRDYGDGEVRETAHGFQFTRTAPAESS